MRLAIAACLSLLLTASSIPAIAATEAPVKKASVAAADSTASLLEQRSVTTHIAKIGGASIQYQAVAGTLTIRDDQDKPIASMFYTAYLLDPGNAGRPVTFFYNGGPGSSSLWLHMASFAPRRVVLNAPYPTANPPFRMVDNDDSLLPQTDLVFLDAINTGYSRPLGESTPETFMTADADIDVFARGIVLFLTSNGRWNSPKFLFGESYGTSRSAGLVKRLQQDGAQVNGLIQLGTILNIDRIIGRGDQAYKAEFPTLALTASYHGKAPRPADRAAYIAELEAWAEGPYSRALAKGNMLGVDEKTAIAHQMAAYAGLNEAFFSSHNLRVTPAQFEAALLRDEGKVIGDLDGRFTGDIAAAVNQPPFDPSWSNVFRPMLTLWNDYVRQDLKFETPLQYRRAYPGTFEKFDFRRKSVDGLGHFGDDLAEAMTVNPHLKVYSLNGLYDFSTVFYGADLDYRHLAIPSSLNGNILYFYYGAGHMAYVDDNTRSAMTHDVRSFFMHTNDP